MLEISFGRLMVPFRILFQEISGKVSVDQMTQEEVWTSDGTWPRIRPGYKLHGPQVQI